MTTYRRIKAVELTAAVIKFLGKQAVPVSAQQIADAVGDAYSTVMCHLATLEDAGFAKQTNGNWELGLYLGVIWVALKKKKEEAYQRAQEELQLLTL